MDISTLLSQLRQERGRVDEAMRPWKGSETMDHQREADRQGRSALALPLGLTTRWQTPWPRTE